MGVLTAWLCCLGRTRTGRGGEAGAANVEYALLVAFIAVVCLGGVSFFGVAVKEYLLEAAAKL